MRHAGAFISDGPGAAVGFPHGAVVLLMGAAEVMGHDSVIVEVGIAVIGILGARVQNALGRSLYFCFLIGRTVRPDKVVVDDIF